MEDSDEADDQFGAALASADFDHDGYDDLAVGVPYEDIFGDGNDEGAVQILYGSSVGVTASGNWIFFQGLGSVEGIAEPDDHYGAVLAASVTRQWLFLPMVRK